MVFTTRKYNYRRNRRYRRYGQRKPNWTRMARDGFYMARKAIGFLNSEVKKKDIAATATNLTSTGGIVHLSNIARGTAESERVGGSILVKNLLYRATVYVGASEPATCRIVLFADMNDNDNTPPTLAQLLESSTGAITINGLNLDNSHRFKILKDWMFTVDAVKKTKMFNEFINFLPDKDNKGINTIGHHATWDKSDGTTKGHIYMAFVSDKASGNPIFSYTSRIGFTDN